MEYLPPCYGARGTDLKTAGFSFMRDFAGLLPAFDSMCRLRFFGRLVFGSFNERRKQINWHGQNGRGVMLARNFLHRL
jgi:hypothetical protein